MNQRSELRYLCDTKNDKKIFYDPLHSHAATHFDDAPALKELVRQILSEREVIGNYLGFDVDMGSPVGYRDVIAVTPDDEIIYAKRKNRNEHVPFVKNRQPEPCPYVSLALKQLDGERYELQSAWIGEFESPPFPEEVGAPPESIPFWDQHAFVWGTQGIQEDTVTTHRPW